MIRINLFEVSDFIKIKIRDNTRKINEQIPTKEGIYFIFNDLYELVYIGSTVNLRSRLLQHTGKKQGSSSKIPVGQAVYCSYILETSLPVGIGLSELIYIYEYNPIYNSIFQDIVENTETQIINTTPKSVFDKLRCDIDRMVF